MGPEAAASHSMDQKQFRNVTRRCRNGQKAAEKLNAESPGIVHLDIGDHGAVYLEKGNKKSQDDETALAEKRLENF